MYTSYTGPHATTNTLKKNPVFCNGVILKGNEKLKDTPCIKFFQFNLPAFKTCPFRSVGCSRFCYANSGRHIMPCCTENRELNFCQSLQDDFVSKMILTLRAAATTKRYKNTLLMLRLHESGDFYSREYLEKWIDILYAIYKDGINFNCHFYTKSFIYFLELGADYTARFNEMIESGVLVMSCSLDDTTTDKQRERIEKVKEKFVKVNTYYAISEIPAGIPADNICKCENCAVCRKCSTASGSTYYVAIHGANKNKK